MADGVKISRSYFHLAIKHSLKFLHYQRQVSCILSLCLSLSIYLIYIYLNFICSSAICSLSTFFTLHILLYLFLPVCRLRVSSASISYFLSLLFLPSLFPFSHEQSRNSLLLAMNILDIASPKFTVGHSYQMWLKIWCEMKRYIYHLSS